MCTLPNYMIYEGQHVDKNMNYVPTYKFLGHYQFKKIVDQNIPFIQVPCGKCLECRLQQTRQWSDRCVLESKNSPYNYFVTLTYDDEHLPPNASLDPKHLTQFVNLLRKHFKRKLGFDGKIRFLACGEYGSASLRPHIHILLFNCPIPDLSYDFYLEEDGKLVKHIRPPSKNNDLYYSQTIYDLWQRKGLISVGNFNYDTAAYVAQYVTKKCVGMDKKHWHELNLYPEFLRMSNGIGKQYFEDHPDVHDTGKLVIDSSGEAHLSSVPRYFDKLFEKKYGKDVFDVISIKRSKKRIINVATNLNKRADYDDQCKIREHNIERQHHLKQGI